MVNGMSDLLQLHISNLSLLLINVYASKDRSLISAWCLHRSQTILSSKQYFWK